MVADCGDEAAHVRVQPLQADRTARQLLRDVRGRAQGACSSGAGRVRWCWAGGEPWCFARAVWPVGATGGALVYSTSLTYSTWHTVGSRDEYWKWGITGGRRAESVSRAGALGDIGRRRRGGWDGCSAHLSPVVVLVEILGRGC